MSGVLFFFSSRRRHTRLQGDWSSDVCSSDLHASGALADGHGRADLCASPTESGYGRRDRKSTRLNSSHLVISYAVFCLKKNISEAELPPAKAMWMNRYMRPCRHLFLELSQLA